MPEITRDQVLEAMARELSDHTEYSGQAAIIALTAIEALGFKIVPYELTDEMYGAAPWIGVDTLRRAYAAMLSASPLYKEPSNG